jgi:hypothetical protein
MSLRFICPDCHQAFYEDTDEACLSMIRDQAVAAKRSFDAQVLYLQDKIRCSRCEHLWLETHAT